MRAVLTTELTVRCTAVFAEMAWMQRRPELGMLCRAALAQGSRLDPSTVARLLPGVTDAGAANLLRGCALLGLCDRQGVLTVLASEVAQHDEVPVPEQGVFALWWVEHLLFGARALGARRLPSEHGPRIDEVTALSMPDLRGPVFSSVVDPTERFVVRSLPSTADARYEVHRPTAARCTLRWTLDFEKGADAWELVGQMEDPGARDGALVPLRPTPTSRGADLGAVLAAWADGPLASIGRWSATTARLAMPLGSLTLDECETFRVRRSFSNVAVPGCGSFARLELQDLPVEPVSKMEAQRWSERRLSRWFASNSGYCRRGDLIRTFRTLVDETPLAPFAPSLPAHETLLAEALQTPTRYWSLAAPVDLALDPVPVAELAAVVVEPPRTLGVESASPTLIGVS